MPGARSPWRAPSSSSPDGAEKEFKLSGYENRPGYANGMPFIARRYCGLWGRGT
jgi:hypothetical protein